MRANIIYNQDCIVGTKQLPDSSIDMVLSDLPYGTTNCSWDSIIPTHLLWQGYNRVCKKDAAIVLTASQPFTSMLVMSNPKNFKYSLVWEKSKATGFLNAKRRPLVAHEDILVFCNGKVPYHPQMQAGEPYDKGVRKDPSPDDVYRTYNKARVKSSGLRYPRSVLYFKTAESESTVIHKTQKPVSLFAYLIKTYTKEGNIVLDSCIGSGTTAVACMQTGRRYIGYEKDPKNYNAAIARVKDVISRQQLSLFASDFGR